MGYTNLKGILPRMMQSCVIIYTHLAYTRMTEMLHTGADPGCCVRGTKVGEGSGDRLRSPAGPWQSPGRGLRVSNPSPLKLLGFEYLGSFSVNNFEAVCECDEVY